MQEAISRAFRRYFSNLHPMKKALSAVTVLALFVSSCIRTYIPIPPPPHTGTTTPDSALSITGLSATTGAGGSNITIYGTGFSTTLAGR